MMDLDSCFVQSECLLLHFASSKRSSFAPLYTKKDTFSGVSLLAWQRPTLTGGSPQLPSAQKSLTTVFGMGTGVTSLLLPPDYVDVRSTANLFVLFLVVKGKRINDSFKTKSRNQTHVKKKFRISPRPISISPLHVSPHFHF